MKTDEEREDEDGTQESTTPSAGVAINWSHNLGANERRFGLATFTNLTTGEQTHFEVWNSIRVCFHLTPGVYRVTLRARDCEVFTGAMELIANDVAPLNPVLEKRAGAAQTLKDVLESFAVENPGVDPGDLTVQRGETVVLDSTNRRFARDWQTVTIEDVAKAKQVIGISDDVWGVPHPRYGSITDAAALGPAELAANAAREYIYGNSNTVAQWTELINSQHFHESWVFPIFIYGTVTIYAGGVLVLTDHSSFFLCQKLRMHVTATLKITGVGPGVIEPLAYETFC